MTNIEKVTTDTFKLTSNFVLVKIDPDYDMVVLDGPDGKKVEIAMVYEGETKANSYAISGTVVSMPEKTIFFNKSTDGICRDEFASLMKESLDVDCEYGFTTGDKIYFNYNVQLSAQEEYRVVETDTHGMCMLIHLSFVFGYEKNGEVVPSNAWVFFERDETPERLELKSGLVGIQNKNPYGSTIGTVKVADRAAKRYLDGQSDPQMELKSGSRIIVDKRFGYRMAYDLHADKLKNVEVVLRKHIFGVLTEEADAV